MECCIFCHSVFVLHIEGRGCPKGMDLRQSPQNYPSTWRGQKIYHTYHLLISQSWILTYDLYIYMYRKMEKSRTQSLPPHPDLGLRNSNSIENFHGKEENSGS